VVVLAAPVSPPHEINPVARTIVKSKTATPGAKIWGLPYPRRDAANIPADISGNAAMNNISMSFCGGSCPLGKLKSDPVDGLDVTLTVSIVVAFPFPGTVTWAGANVQLTPTGAPGQENVNALVNPLLDAADIVKFAELPTAMVAEPAEGDSMTLPTTTCTA
jgi:hypothetical protein